MAAATACFSLLFMTVLCSINCNANPNTRHGNNLTQPEIPAWPHEFTIHLDIFVQIYGEHWSSTGTLYYDWLIKVITYTVHSI